MENTHTPRRPAATGRASLPQLRLQFDNRPGWGEPLQNLPRCRRCWRSTYRGDCTRQRCAHLKRDAAGRFVGAD